MKEIRTDFANEEEKKQFVSDTEAVFEDLLSRSVERIAGEEGVRIVTVSGPSCSGKTTASAKLERALERNAREVHVISIDDFFLGRSYLVQKSEGRGKKLDFDSPETIDCDALAAVVEEIFAMREVNVPIFDFVSGERAGYRRLPPPEERDVYIFEGIQAVYPNVTALFGTHPYRSLYISVEEDVKLGDTVITRDRLRFLRRLVRDAHKRGASPAFTFRLWDTVRENEIKNIMPFRKNADLTINSYIAYEVNMLRDEAMNLLSSADDIASEYLSVRDFYLSLLESIPSVSPAYLPPHSFFHEFLG